MSTHSKLKSWSLLPGVLVILMAFSEGRTFAEQLTAFAPVPAAGTGTSQLFTFHASDSSGYGSIPSLNEIINSSLNAVGACYFDYNRDAHWIGLADNGATTFGTGGTLGSSTVLSNSQCTINLAQSSVTGSGNDLYLTVAITFYQAFSGSKGVYEEVFNSSGQGGGWFQVGTWTVGTSLLAPDSIFPPSGTGGTQTFTFTGSSPSGSGYIDAMWLQFNWSLESAGGCFVIYSQTGNAIWLVNDTGSQWLGGYAPGTNNVLSNSQCSFNTASVTVFGFANTLVLQVPLTFTTAFIGPEVVYGEVTDKNGGSSGYQTLGSWTPYAAPYSQLPTPLAPQPNGGTGMSQLFTFHASDLNGYRYIPAMWALINSSSNTVNACYFAYDPAAQTIGLANDQATNFGNGGTLGSSTVLSNSQCTINLAQSYPSNSGNDLYLNLFVTFNSQWTGQKNVYEIVWDRTQQNTGWVQVGTWTVGTSGGGGSWYSTGGTWTHRKAVTIDHTKVSGSTALSNFPVLVSLASDANLAAGAQASGNDILFTALDGVTKLNHQIEQYTPGSGQLVAWVQVPTLSYTADTVVYMYYGNASASNQQNAAGVWDSNYKGVWHLANGSALSLNDSTANGNNGTNHGATAGTTAQIGNVSAALNHSGYITGSGVSSLANSAYTVSYWLYVDTTANQGYQAAFGAGSVYGLTDGNIFAGISDYFVTTKLSQWTEEAYCNYGSSIYHRWTHFTFTVDSAKHFAIYLNGQQGTYSGCSGTLTGLYQGNGDWAIGTLPSQIGYFVYGNLQEVRASNTNRSAGWIATEYTNQSVPGSFYSVGAEQAGGGTVYYLTTSAGVGGAISPQSGSYYSGSVVTVRATAGPGYVFAGFSGALSGATTPQNLTITGTSSVSANFTYVGVPDFTITASPTTQTVTSGSTAQFAITVNPINGFSGFVSFSAPGFAGISFNPYSSATQTTMYVPAQSGGTYNITVYGQSGSFSHSVTVTLSYSSSSLPSVSCSASPNPATPGQTVTLTANGSGGTPAYTYAWSGLASGSGQSLSFAAPSAGAYTESVTLTDSASHTASNSCSLTVQSSGTLTITTTSLQTGYVNESYSQSLTAAGGTGSNSWSVSSGSLPAGTQLSPTGTVSGPPSLDGDYNFTATVTSGSQNSSVSLVWSIRRSWWTTTLADFTRCIGPNPPLNYVKCVFTPDPATYPSGRVGVGTPPLSIGRSGTPRLPLVITGGGGPGATVLYRAASSMTNIMNASSSAVTNVVIENLTFDGDRFDPSISDTTYSATTGGRINCLPWPPPKIGTNPDVYATNYIDVDLALGGTFTLQWLNFINSPHWALNLSGSGSSVSVSNFGMAQYSIGPSGNLENPGDNPDPNGAPRLAKNAIRHAGIHLGGSNNGAWYNDFQYNGDGAIDMDGSSQVFYGNLLRENRYEMPDLGGGQVYVAPGSSGAVVAGNVIDGTPGYMVQGSGITTLWSSTLLWGTNPQTLDTTCAPPPSGQGPTGIEVYGTGHFLYNNEVENNFGAGMQLAGSNVTNDITISSWNPYDPAEGLLYPAGIQRYIEQNGFDGIRFLGPNTVDCTDANGYHLGYIKDQNSNCTLPAIAANGVTLDSVLVRDNAGFGVTLDSVTNDNFNMNGEFGGFYTGFFAASYTGGNSIACLNIGNQFGPLGYTSSLASPTPTSGHDGNWFQRTTKDVTSGQEVSCPATQWPTEPNPSHSNITGWKW